MGGFTAECEVQLFTRNANLKTPQQSFCISRVKSSCRAVFAVLLKMHKESALANEPFESSELGVVSITLVLPLE